MMKKRMIAVIAALALAFSVVAAPAFAGWPPEGSPAGTPFIDGDVFSQQSADGFFQTPTLAVGGTAEAETMVYSGDGGTWVIPGSDVDSSYNVKSVTALTSTNPNVLQVGAADPSTSQYKLTALSVGSATLKFTVTHTDDTQETATLDVAVIPAPEPKIWYSVEDGYPDMDGNDGVSLSTSVGTEAYLWQWGPLDDVGLNITNKGVFASANPDIVIVQTDLNSDSYMNTYFKAVAPGSTTLTYSVQLPGGGVLTKTISVTVLSSGGGANPGGSGGSSTAPSNTWAGSNSTFTLGGKTELINTTEKDFALFSGVKVDGKTIVQGTDYTAKAGSTDITLLPVYLNTLGIGSHKLSVEFTDGVEVSSTFKIAAASSALTLPGTGDSSATLLISAAALIAVAGAALLLWSKKERSSVEE